MRNNANPSRRAAARGKVDVSPEVMARWPLLKVVVDGMQASGDYSRSTIQNYRKAVRVYQKFIGYEQSAINVTEERFDEFRAWLPEHGCSEAMTALHLECLAAVVRFADDRLLSSRATSERKPLADAEIRGSIEWFLVNEFFPVRGNVRAEETKRQYAMAIAKFSSCLGRPAAIADLADDIVGAWMQTMLEEGLKVRTINNYATAVRAFWSWAFRRNIATSQPRVKNLPASAEKPPETAEPQETPPRKPIERHVSDADVGRDLLGPRGILRFVGRYLAVRDVSDDYAANLRKRAIKLGRFAGAADIERLFRQDVVNDFLHSLDRAPRTIVSYRSDIVSLWHDAADQDLVPYPILRRLWRPKCPELVIDCYTVEEMQRLLAAAGRLTGEYRETVPKRLYWTAAILLAWDTGLRRGDVWAFRKSAVRDDGSARVVQRKTGKIVTVRLRPATIGALAAIPYDQPCAWMLDRSFFGRHFRKIVVDSGVNRGSFKWIRRASSTFVDMQQPGAGTKHLGHASPGVFDRHYDGKLGGHTLPMPPELIVAE